MSTYHSDRIWPDLRNTTPQAQRQIGIDALNRTTHSLYGLVLILESDSDERLSGLSAILHGITEDCWLALGLLSETDSAKT